MDKEKKAPAPRGILKTVSETLEPAPQKPAPPPPPPQNPVVVRYKSTSSPCENLKPVLAAFLVGSVFAIVCFCVVFPKPCRLSMEFGNGNRTKLKIQPRRFDTSNASDMSLLYYDNQTRSVQYGKAGGVKHFVFGKLPTMDSSRLTEPSLEEANYLHYRCGEAQDIRPGDGVFETGQYKPSNFTDIPWLVHIAILESVNTRINTVPIMISVCGGAMIASKWVLTATHCYDFNKIHKTVVAYKKEGNIHVARHEKLYPYPGYDDKYNQHDILLVKLKQDLKLRIVNVPVCMPNPNVVPRTGRVCVVIGGSGGDLENSEMLTMWTVLDNPTDCQARYCGLKYDVNNNICDEGTISRNKEKEKDKCHGLSGNPLVCNEHGRWVAYGILNWSGPECNVTEGRGYALISTRMKWICKYVTLREWSPCKKLNRSQQ